jgi:hypothetical protein
MLKKAKWQEESSFCEQKEAKKLWPLEPALSTTGSPMKKVFCFFFSKKKILPSCPLPF